MCFMPPVRGSSDAVLLPFKKKNHIIGANRDTILLLYVSIMTCVWLCSACVESVKAHDKETLVKPAEFLR